MFSRKNTRDFEELEREYAELKEEYSKAVKEIEGFKKVLPKVHARNKELEEELEKKSVPVKRRNRKIEIYLSRFLQATHELEKEGKTFPDAGGQYDCCLSVDFKAKLEGINVEVRSTLEVFRTLDLIKTDKGAFTTVRRVDGKGKRVITWNVAKVELLKKLWKKV